MNKIQLFNAISDILGTATDNLMLEDFLPENSMTSKIESAELPGIVKVRNVSTAESFVIKIKTSAFIDAVGIAMNVFNDADVAKSYAEGHRIFYTHNSYVREKFVYENLKQHLKDYTPHYFGGKAYGNECVHIMELLSFDKPFDLEKACEFAAKLHAVYMGRFSETDALLTNIHRKEDYVNAKNLSLLLLKNIVKLYPDFGDDITASLNEFVKSPERNFEYTEFLGKTVCHGDYCAKNMAFTESGIKVYDWELSTYNNPEFDLAALLIHYPTTITKNDVDNAINYYVRYFNLLSDTKKTADVVKQNLAFNVKLYAATRFHAMMNIAVNLPMPYMKESVENYKFLFRYLDCFKSF